MTGFVVNHRKDRTGRNGIDIPFVPQFNHGEVLTLSRSDTGQAITTDRYGRRVHA